MELPLFTNFVAIESQESSSSSSRANASTSSMSTPLAPITNHLNIIPSIETMTIREQATTTPVPSTPQKDSDIVSPPIKKVISLDMEMRYRKRRRVHSEEENNVFLPPPGPSLGLPDLLDDESCECNNTCLPSASLRRKKGTTMRRRSTIIWSTFGWADDRRSEMEWNGMGFFHLGTARTSLSTTRGTSLHHTKTVVNYLSKVILFL